MFVMAEVAAGLVTRNDGRKYVTLDSSFRFLRGSSAKNIQGWRRSQSAGRPSALQKLRSWRPIRGSFWQKENLRFIVWVSRDKNKNPAITRVFETYLGEPTGKVTQSTVHIRSAFLGLLKKYNLRGVIFITEKDYYQAGKAVYMIQNMNQTLNQPFGDGAHILYVNGEYRDDSAIGKLMHDFNCADADDMHYGLLAERTRYLKENSKGVNEMYRTMDEVEKSVMRKDERRS